MAGDSQNEPKRLADLYAGMSNGELEKIAADLPSLTEAAQRALEDEIRRRGIEQPQPDSPAGVDEIDFQKLITIRKLRDLPEALLAKGSLDSAGIESFLADDNMVRMDWFISNLLGGVKLQVRPEDVDAADEILNQPIPDGFDVEGVGDYQQPRCPKCESLDISFEELNKLIAYGGLFVNVPLPVHRKGWTCHSCGQRWEVVEDPKIT